MSSHVQAILTLLKDTRSLAAQSVTTTGSDGRLYVQVVGVPGFPVFTINPTGKYDLPFEHSFTNDGMMKMGLPILVGRSEGLNAVLFADQLAARTRNRHDLCVGFDPDAIERVREMAVKAHPQESPKIWRKPGNGISNNAAPRTEFLPPRNQSRQAACTHPAPLSSPQTASRQYSPAVGACRYFETEDGEIRALEACRSFLGGKDWAVSARLKLYDASRYAFNPNCPTGDDLGWFRKIYDDLVLPAPAGGWGIARNASGPLWSAEKTLHTIKHEFSSCSWSKGVALMNFRNVSIQPPLVSSLEKMRTFKPVAHWPVMAVSKVLHFYNPELFPIYDNEVICNKVLRRFKNEFREFCMASSPPYDFGDTPIFYRNYMFWGASLLASAHPRFMDVFAEWLAKQPGVDLSKRQFDVSRLFATAYEYVIIGAYADHI